MVASLLAPLLLLSVLASEIVALNYWRLRILSQSSTNWEVYFYELQFKDIAGAVIPGTYSSSRPDQDAQIGLLSDGDTTTRFRFPASGSQYVVGDFIKFQCSGCTPYSIFLWQFGGSDNQIKSLILESSADGTIWTAEGPAFATISVGTYSVAYPTAQPTLRPTANPSLNPTANPTPISTAAPSNTPTLSPTANPSIIPTLMPTATPTVDPSASPTMQPTTPLDLMLERFRTSPTYTVRNGFAFAALTANQSVVTWGEAAHGGDSSTVQVRLEDNVNGLVSTRYAFAASKDGGKLVMWGESAVVRGHDNQYAYNLTGVVATESSFAGVHFPTKTAFAFGSAQSGGVSTIPLTNIQSVTASAGAFAALKNDLSVVAWGSEHYGGAVPSGVQSELHSAVQIVATRDAFAARLTSGKVLAWGSALGGGDTSAVTNKLASGVLHVAASGAVFAALKSDSSVVTWGHSDGGGDSSAVQSALHDIKTIVGNSKAFAALTQDGKVVAWGKSVYGGSIPQDKAAALASGVVSIHATNRAFAALKTSGQLVVWGRAGHGGSPGAAVEALLQSGVHTVCANDVAFSAIKRTGEVVAWGHAVSVAAPGVQFVDAALRYNANC